MVALTPAERRGALVVVALLTLGTMRDLWIVWRRPHTASLSVEPAWQPASGATASSPSRPTAPAEAAGSAGAVPVPGPLVTVDVNRADEQELDALPGIGPVLAGRIVAYRHRFGPFRQPEDLLAVPGIGPRLFARLRPRIAVDSVFTRPPGAPPPDAKRTAGRHGRVQISLQSRPGTDR